MIESGWKISSYTQVQVKGSYDNANLVLSTSAGCYTNYFKEKLL